MRNVDRSEDDSTPAKRNPVSGKRFELLSRLDPASLPDLMHDKGSKMLNVERLEAGAPARRDDRSAQRSSAACRVFRNIKV